MVGMMVLPSAGGNDRDWSGEFTIESRTAEAIEVQHLARGHNLYTFRILQGKQGRRILKGAYRGQSSKVYERVMAFAEREARKAGLID
jgi:hypothetical protein